MAGAAAFFFATYDTSKQAMLAQPGLSPSFAPFVHMVAAGFGEVAACLVRVPTAVVTQNMQARRRAASARRRRRAMA